MAKRFFFALLITIGLSFGLAGCAIGETEGRPIGFPSVPTSEVEVIDETYAGKSTDYYYQLSDVEKRLYGAVYNACVAFEDTFTIILNQEEYENVRNNDLRFAEALRGDHPEIIHYTGAYETKTIEQTGKNIMTFTLSTESYLGTLENCKAEQKKMCELASEVTTQIMAECPDEYSRVLRAHDYIIEHTDYDRQRMMIYDTKDREGDSGMIYTAYGLLMHGSAVCEGYAKAMKLLMDQMNIPSLCVFTEDHAFNIVWINGDPTYIDVCWDDPTKIEEDGTINREDTYIQHTYFGLTSAIVTNLESHDLSESRFDLPLCTNEGLRYHVYIGAYMATYEPEAAKAMISAQKASGASQIEILFGNADEFDKAVADLMDANRIREIPEFATCAIEYTTDSETCILRIKETE